MTRVQFDNLVTKLDSKFKQNDDKLKTSSMIWAITGYVVLVIYIIICLALVAGCILFIYAAPNALTLKVGILIGLAAGGTCLSIIRSLWLRIQPVEGHELKREDAPELFEMIDTLSEAAGGVIFHKVIVIEELNASVIQNARAGIFGFYRNTLSIGLPLLDALSPEEFKAVLAHEFSHLSSADGKIGNWIYRIRNTWENIANHTLNQGGILNTPLRGFFSWFWPHFNARAFLLSRANEYRADAFSAKLTSNQQAMTALQRISIVGRNLGEGFWSKIGDSVTTEEEPPKQIFTQMKTFMSEPIPSDKLSKWLSQEFATKTNNSDTHPSLKDRCAALGITEIPDQIPAIDRNAADYYLGEELTAKLRNKFNQEWYDVAKPNWSQRREYLQNCKEELQKLERLEHPDTDTLWKCLSLKAQIHGYEKVKDELHAFVASNPNHAFAAYALGSNLLAADDASGIPYMEFASKEASLTLDCLSEMAAFHDRNGNHNQINDLLQKADAHDSVLAKLEQASINISNDDRFVYHDLPDYRIETICEAFASMPEIKTAWLAKRQNPNLGQSPHYLLVLEIKFPPFKFSSGNANQDSINKLIGKLNISENILILDTNGENKAVMKRVARETESLIYEKKK